MNKDFKVKVLDIYNYIVFLIFIANLNYTLLSVSISTSWNILHSCMTLNKTSQDQIIEFFVSFL